MIFLSFIRFCRHHHHPFDQSHFNLSNDSDFADFIVPSWCCRVGVVPFLRRNFCKYDTSALLTTSNKCRKSKTTELKSFFLSFSYSFSTSFMENSAVFSEEAADQIEKNHVFHVYDQISDHFSETRYDHNKKYEMFSVQLTIVA